MAPEPHESRIFPGLFELSCAFCGKYKHANKDEWKVLYAERHVSDEEDDANTIVCNDCWELVQVFVKRSEAEIKRLKWRLNHQTDDDVAACKGGLHEDCGA